VLPLQADGDLIGSALRWEVSLVPRAVRMIGAWR
jgi:hypothetical protein